LNIVSESAIESILYERTKGKFTSLRDFVLRTNVSRPILENLVKIGAFDSLEGRNGLLLQLPKLAELKQRVAKGTTSLFEDNRFEAELFVDTSNNDRKAKLLIERELLSLDLSAHPLDFYDYDAGITRMKDLSSIPTGKRVKLVGSVIRYQTPPTRNGKRVVYVIMEDGTGIADVTVFSDVQEKCGQVLFREGWIVVEGKIQRRGLKATSIIAEHLSPLNKTHVLFQSC
jgi:error-prone DNA polymerase